MFKIRTQIALAAALAAGFASNAALAGGKGKDVYVQDYTFAKPMHGYSGNASGGYYCDYQRLPNRKCTTDRNGNEKCVIVSWTLRQMCH